jgi:carboxymethylenebutenolidase
VAEVRIPTAHGELPAYLARPAGEGPWPGVVVIHDGLGMSPDARDHAGWLAGEGFLAVAPDLFHWGGRARGLIAYARGARRSLSELEATRAWLAGQDHCTGRLGVFGCSMGGHLALKLAQRGGFSAASVNYGGRVERERDLRDACPIVASYGGRDRWPGVRRNLDRLGPALEAAGVEHDVKRYPDAGHGFLNDHDPADLPLWVKGLGRLVAAEYDETSARDARRRTASFFRVHLSDGGSGG